MTLREKRWLFTQLLARLIVEIELRGYEATLGEVYRSPEEARRLAKLGKGILNSLHCDGLAADVNLFKDGHYLASTDAHLPFGEWWEQQHPLCRWGGRFKDGNHYAVEHGGRK